MRTLVLHGDVDDGIELHSPVEDEVRIAKELAPDGDLRERPSVSASEQGEGRGPTTSAWPDRRISSACLPVVMSPTL